MSELEETGETVCVGPRWGSLRGGRTMIQIPYVEIAIRLRRQGLDGDEKVREV